MSKLIITVNGKQYEVEVEVLEDSSPEDIYGSAPQPAPRPKARAAAAATPKAKPAKKVVDTAIASTDGLNSPINGVVLDIPVKVGDAVKEGDVVIVLEAMKMKTNIFAPNDATIAEILVGLGDNIESGQKLVKFA